MLPSPMTVTWLSPASTGAEAAGSVWLPDPLPSLAVGGVAVGAAGGVALGGGVVGGVAVTDDRHLVARWRPRARSTAGSVWLPAPVPFSPLVVLPPVAPVVSPSVRGVVGSVAVTDHRHLVAGGVHGRSRAGVGLVARPVAVRTRRRRCPPVAVAGRGAAARSRLTRAGVAVTDDGHLVPARVHWSDGRRAGLVAGDRAVVTVVVSAARPRRGTLGGAVVGLVAVTDHRHLVAGGVDRCHCAGVGLVARAGAVLARRCWSPECRRPEAPPWSEELVSLLLPSPITVTWLPEASTGAVAPASDLVARAGPVLAVGGAATARARSRRGVRGRRRGRRRCRPAVRRPPGRHRSR